MAIQGGGELIFAPGYNADPTQSFGANLLQLFMVKMQMDQQKELLKLQQQKLKLEEDETRQRMSISAAQAGREQAGWAAQDRAATGALRQQVGAGDQTTLQTLQGAGALGQQTMNAEQILAQVAGGLMGGGGGLGFQGAPPAPQIAPQVGTLAPGEAPALLQATRATREFESAERVRGAQVEASEAQTFVTYAQNRRDEDMHPLLMALTRAQTNAQNAAASADRQRLEREKKEIERLNFEMRRVALDNVRAMDKDALNVAISLKNLNPTLDVGSVRRQAAAMVYGVAERPADDLLVQREMSFLQNTPETNTPADFAAYQEMQRLTSIAMQIGVDPGQVDFIEAAIAESKGNGSRAMELVIEKSPTLANTGEQGRAAREAVAAYITIRTGKPVQLKATHPLMKLLRSMQQSARHNPLSPVR